MNVHIDTPDDNPAGDSVPDGTGDDRPNGWGVCSVCQRDCEPDDYDVTTRLAICRFCWVAVKDIPARGVA